MHLLLIHYLYPEFTWSFLSFREFTMNSLSFSRIYFGFPIFSRIHFEFTIIFANPLSIHYLFRELTTNSLSFSKIHFGFPILFAISLRIHYFCREPSFNSLSFNFEVAFMSENLFSIHYPCLEFTCNTQSFKRIYFQFTIFFFEITTNYLLFYISFFNSLSSLKIHVESTIILAK